MENLYDIIGVSPSVSDEELDSAYKKLREKYGEERFQNGPAGEEAADKLEKLERAYSEIKRARSEYKSYGQDSEQAYAAIEEVLKNGDINKAQEMLDNLTPPPAHIYTELIMDGRVLAGNLRRKGLDEQWLQTQLQAQGFRSAGEVFLGLCDENNQLSLYHPETAENSPAQS